MNTDSLTAQTRTTWRKSSYSTFTGDGVEAGPGGRRRVIRHSKHPTAGTITFPHHAWAAFIREAPEGRPTVSIHGCRGPA
jgi:hypothetical protein